MLMGGRGASSSTARGKSAANGPLGPKGRAANPLDAAARANPNYAKGVEWQYNCQRCVVAYELLRRGYDVEARVRVFKNDPVFSRGNGSVVVRFGKRDGMNVGVPSFKGQKWEKPGPKDRRSPKTVMADIDAKMSGWGEGSRAIVAVAWKGGGAHVFIAERMNGTVRYIDPQSGRMDASSHFNRAMPSSVHVSRVDNLSPADSIIGEYVKKR